MRKFFSFCIISSVLFPTLAWSDCPGTTKDILVGSSLGSAAAWRNIAGSDGSIKKETEKLLNQAISGKDSVQAPKDLCPIGCAEQSAPVLFLLSIPNKYLSDYSDKAECENQLAKTTRDPIRYNGLHFDTLEDLNSWFSDFSQGKGKLGNDLYKKCPGSCSPQYTNIITPVSAGYDVLATVICGPARDKGDNQYKLSTGYRWSCQDK